MTGFTWTMIFLNEKKMMNFVPRLDVIDNQKHKSDTKAGRDISRNRVPHSEHTARKKKRQRNQPTYVNNRFWEGGDRLFLSNQENVRGYVVSLGKTNRTDRMK